MTTTPTSQRQSSLDITNQDKSNPFDLLFEHAYASLPPSPDKPLRDLYTHLTPRTPQTALTALSSLALMPTTPAGRSGVVARLAAAPTFAAFRKGFAYAAYASMAEEEEEEGEDETEEGEVESGARQLRKALSEAVKRAEGFVKGGGGEMVLTPGLEEMFFTPGETRFGGEAGGETGGKWVTAKGSRRRVRVADTFEVDEEMLRVERLFHDDADEETEDDDSLQSVLERCTPREGTAKMWFENPEKDDAASPVDVKKGVEEGTFESPADPQNVELKHHVKFSDLTDSETRLATCNENPMLRAEHAGNGINREEPVAQVMVEDCLQVVFEDKKIGKDMGNICASVRNLGNEEPCKEELGLGKEHTYGLVNGEVEACEKEGNEMHHDSKVLSTNALEEKPEAMDLVQEDNLKDCEGAHNEEGRTCELHCVSPADENAGCMNLAEEKNSATSHRNGNEEDGATQIPYGNAVKDNGPCMNLLEKHDIQSCKVDASEKEAVPKVHCANLVEEHPDHTDLVCEKHTETLEEVSKWGDKDTEVARQSTAEKVELETSEASENDHGVEVVASTSHQLLPYVGSSSDQETSPSLSDAEEESSSELYESPRQQGVQEHGFVLNKHADKSTSSETASMDQVCDGDDGVVKNLVEQGLSFEMSQTATSNGIKDAGDEHSFTETSNHGHQAPDSCSETFVCNTGRNLVSDADSMEDKSNERVEKRGIENSNENASHHVETALIHDTVCTSNQVLQSFTRSMETVDEESDDCVIGLERYGHDGPSYSTSDSDGSLGGSLEMAQTSLQSGAGRNRKSLTVIQEQQPMQSLKSEITTTFPNKTIVISTDWSVDEALDEQEARENIETQVYDEENVASTKRSCHKPNRKAKLEYGDVSLVPGITTGAFGKSRFTPMAAGELTIGAWGNVPSTPPGLKFNLGERHGSLLESPDRDFQSPTLAEHGDIATSIGKLTFSESDEEEGNHVCADDTLSIGTRDTWAAAIGKYIQETGSEKKASEGEDEMKANEIIGMNKDESGAEDIDGTECKESATHVIPSNTVSSVVRGASSEISRRDSLENEEVMKLVRECLHMCKDIRKDMGRRRRGWGGMVVGGIAWIGGTLIVGLMFGAWLRSRRIGEFVINFV